jgi:hypothetical protein
MEAGGVSGGSISDAMSGAGGRSYTEWGSILYGMGVDLIQNERRGLSISDGMSGAGGSVLHGTSGARAKHAIFC